jgi:copper chaperone
METQLQISGMTCGHCVQIVTKSLQNVPGVRLAAVDLASGHTTVKHDTGADPQAMVAAVEEEGYSALVKSTKELSHET